MHLVRNNSFFIFTFIFLLCGLKKTQQRLHSLWSSSCCEGQKYYPRFRGNVERRRNLFYLFFPFVLQKQFFVIFLLCKGLQVSEP